MVTRGMALTLEQYADYLDTRDLSWPAAPDVAKPKAKPHLVRMPEVRVVTWSVYGTLLAISGGELVFEHPQKFVMDIALDKTLQEFKMWGSMSRKPGQPAEYLGQMYRKVFDDFRLMASPGEKYPEVLAEQIWEGVLKKLLQKEYQFDVGFYGSLNELSRKVAYFFHASLQGVACHAGTVTALKAVAAAGCRQGLIDNGQVFTMVQLARCLRQQDKATILDKLIDPELCVLSHQLRARKPSERLFRQLLDKVETEGISPEQVLHVGSDVEKDIIPAKKLGIRTALFAGDKESLRATPEQLKDADSRPDILITELKQIAKVISAKS
jgi:FMN phosphatase YigB (HAD superfamily)